MLWLRTDRASVFPFCRKLYAVLYALLNSCVCSPSSWCEKLFSSLTLWPSISLEDAHPRKPVCISHSTQGVMGTDQYRISPSDAVQTNGSWGKNQCFRHASWGQAIHPLFWQIYIISHFTKQDTNGKKPSFAPPRILQGSFVAKQCIQKGIC